MIVTLSLMYCAETLLNIRSKHRNEVEVSNLKQQIQSLIPFMDICQEFKAKIESGETGSVRVYTRDSCFGDNLHTDLLVAGRNDQPQRQIAGIQRSCQNADYTGPRSGSSSACAAGSGRYDRFLKERWTFSYSIKYR